LPSGFGAVDAGAGALADALADAEAPFAEVVVEASTGDARVELDEVASEVESAHPAKGTTSSMPKRIEYRDMVLSQHGSGHCFRGSLPWWSR